MGEITNVCNNIPVVNPECKRPLERPKCKWKDNIKYDFEEMRCHILDWVVLAHGNAPARVLLKLVLKHIFVS